MKIEMKNQPRFSGKTASIKLKALEAFHNSDYDFICIINHSKDAENNTYHWLAGIHCHHNNIVVGYQLLKERLKLISKDKDKKILILIDEPFIMDKKKQKEILQDISLLEMSYCFYFDIYGIGTMELTSDELLFEDFLDE